MSFVFLLSFCLDFTLIKCLKGLKCQIDYVCQNSSESLTTMGRYRAIGAAENHFSFFRVFSILECDQTELFFQVHGTGTSNGEENGH